MKVEQIYAGCLAQGVYYIESNGEIKEIRMKSIGNRFWKKDELRKEGFIKIT
jgi:hypothetical protein